MFLYSRFSTSDEVVQSLHSLWMFSTFQAFEVNEGELEFGAFSIIFLEIFGVAESKASWHVSEFITGPSAEEPAERKQCILSCVRRVCPEAENSSLVHSHNRSAVWFPDVFPAALMRLHWPVTVRTRASFHRGFGLISDKNMFLMLHIIQVMISGTTAEARETD